MKPGGAERFVGGVFGAVFFCVGLTVVGFLIGASSNGFDAPPLVFRIFGSLIGIAFMAMGGTLAVSAITGGGLMKSNINRLMEQAGSLNEALGNRAQPPKSIAPGSYICPGCGATLQKADVSPMGDVKCPFCGSWFNVHARS